MSDNAWAMISTMLWGVVLVILVWKELLPRAPTKTRVPEDDEFSLDK